LGVAAVGLVVVVLVLLLTNKAVPLAAHCAAHDHRAQASSVDRSISNVVGQDEAHQLWHDPFHSPPSATLGGKNFLFTNCNWLENKTKQMQHTRQGFL
jgi:hypothetical protein